MTVSLTVVELPELSDLGREPKLQAGVYERRLARLRSRMVSAGLDAILVYADREHYANVSYLTGFDPRFEEAVLLIASEGEPIVLTGNESISLCDHAGLPVRGVLCQSLSLPSQDRSVLRRLADGLAEAGLARAAKCGLIGWKPIPREDSPASRLALAVPQFVLSEVEDYLDHHVADATMLLCGVDGLRADNEADQLALHEHRATRASQCAWRGLHALRPGDTTELNVSAAMRLVGLPISCHVMCTSGAESVNGLSSPSDRVIQVGDRFSIAVGFWGGLCCRAGLVVEAHDARTAEFVECFAQPYYAGIRTWYEALAIGTTGGEVSSVVRDALEPSAVRALLDAGHLIHLDEWFDSVFWPGSESELRSGMALQCDIIPVSERFPGYAANVEDSLALADTELRSELADRYPDLWQRVSARRRFMTDVLGFDLAEEILPFSDRQGVFPPALLSLDTLLVTTDA